MKNPKYAVVIARKGELNDEAWKSFLVKAHGIGAKNFHAIAFALDSDAIWVVDMETNLAALGKLADVGESVLKEVFYLENAPVLMGA